MAYGRYSTVTSVNIRTRKYGEYSTNFMNLNTFITPIDTLSEHIGKAISWLTVAMVVITFIVVILRYGFDIGWIWMQESVAYMYAWIFMFGAGYTLKHEGHVRVDIFYRQFTIKQQAWVNLLGTLFLLFPMFIFIAWISFDYVVVSWRISESSREAGGLAFVYLLKTSLLIMPALVVLQGLALVLRSLKTLLNIQQTPIQTNSADQGHND